MADKDYKVFIVEGEVRESQIIDNILKFSLIDYIYSYGQIAKRRRNISFCN